MDRVLAHDLCNLFLKLNSLFYKDISRYFQEHFFDFVVDVEKQLKSFWWLSLLNSDAFRLHKTRHVAHC